MSSLLKLWKEEKQEEELIEPSFDVAIYQTHESFMDF